MSHKSKKKRPSCLFDLDNIKASIQAKASRTDRVRELLRGLREVDVNDLISNEYDLGEHDIITILTSKISIQTLNYLRKALQHVPTNITRVVDKTPMRSAIIFKVFTSLRSTATGTFIHPTVEELETYGKILETRCPLFMSVDTDLSNQDSLLDKYLTPPVSVCTRCDKRLSMRNNPSRAVLFTLNGPVPCSKFTLECRNCSIHFGVCNYTDRSGTCFYPLNFDLDLIEVSNVTYFHRDLYQWMPSLR